MARFDVDQVLDDGEAHTFLVTEIEQRLGRKATAAEILDWTTDEAAVQEYQAALYPDEAEDRLPYAAVLRSYARQIAAALNT